MYYVSMMQEKTLHCCRVLDILHFVLLIKMHVLFSRSRKFFLVLLIVMSFTCIGCPESAESTMSLQALLTQHWVHSYEEDVDDLQVYRPVDYSFPLSRGRSGFEVQENGKFIYYSIGPTDRPQAILGDWELITDTRIRVALEEGESQPFVLEIIEVGEDYIKVRKVFE